MFNVFASYKSVISTNTAVRFKLESNGRGFAFVNIETRSVETGTYVEGNAFAALDKFRAIFREMSPSFELIA